MTDEPNPYAAVWADISANKIKLSHAQEAALLSLAARRGGLAEGDHALIWDGRIERGLISKGVITSEGKLTVAGVEVANRNFQRVRHMTIAEWNWNIEREALFRKVDYVIKARECSQRYAALIEPLANVKAKFGSYSRERTLADWLKTQAANPRVARRADGVTLGLEELEHLAELLRAK